MNKGSLIHHSHAECAAQPHGRLCVQARGLPHTAGQHRSSLGTLSLTLRPGPWVLRCGAGLETQRWERGESQQGRRKESGKGKGRYQPCRLAMCQAWYSALPQISNCPRKPSEVGSIILFQRSGVSER